MSWAPGTIVVCVDASPFVPTGNPVPLVRDEYYTIRSTRLSRDQEAVPMVHLKEIVMPIGCKGVEVGFAARRFRLAESTHSEAGSVRREESANA